MAKKKGNKGKGNGGEPSAPPLPPQAGRPKPPLPGIFEDYYFVEIYMSRPVRAHPADIDGWYIGAMPHKVLGNQINATGFVSYAYDAQSGLMAIPHAFQVNLFPHVNVDEQGNPVPTTLMAIKGVGDIVLRASAVSHVHTLTPGDRAASGAPGERDPDFSMMSLTFIQRSMSKIVRPPPGASGLLTKP